jgi:hypothetical protein
MYDVLNDLGRIDVPVERIAGWRRGFDHLEQLGELGGVAALLRF